jgi:hypothetical protein
MKNQHKSANTADLSCRGANCTAGAWPNSDDHSAECLKEAAKSQEWPVPPAGDVEVLMVSLKDHKLGQAALLEHIESLKADRTRLTAERDGLLAEVEQEKQRHRTHAAQLLIQRGQLREQRDTLQSELTKARELVRVFSAEESTIEQVQAAMTESDALFTTPIAHNVDESCGQDAECNYCGGDGYHAAPQTPGTTCEACNGCGQDAEADRNYEWEDTFGPDYTGEDAEAAKGNPCDDLANRRGF